MLSWVDEYVCNSEVICYLDLNWQNMSLQRAEEDKIVEYRQFAKTMF